MFKIPVTKQVANSTAPYSAIHRNSITNTIKNLLEKASFNQMQTPTLQNADLLLHIDNNYCLDFTSDGKHLALPYDLTVPMALFVANNYNEIEFPFKRYQIQKVWRKQDNSINEFHQCDFDILGCDSKIADTEIILLIIKILAKFNLRNWRLLFCTNSDKNTEIIANLQSLGIDDNKIIESDAVAGSFNYYSGIKFAIEINQGDQWLTIGKGGRYDNLCAKLSSKLSPLKIFGVGFSLDIELLFTILAAKTATIQTQVLLCNKNLADSANTLQLYLQLIDENISVNLYSYSTNLEKIQNYARQNSIKFIVYLDGEQANIITTAKAKSKQISKRQLLTFLKNYV